MNERSIRVARAVMDLVYTGVCLAIVGYAIREDLRKYVAGKRHEIETRTAAVRDAAETTRKRGEFVSLIGPRIRHEEACDDPTCRASNHLLHSIVVAWDAMPDSEREALRKAGINA